MNKKEFIEILAIMDKLNIDRNDNLTQAEKEL